MDPVTWHRDVLDYAVIDRAACVLPAHANESRSLLPTSGMQLGWARRAVKAVQASTDAIVASMGSGTRVLASKEYLSNEEGIIEWLELYQESSVPPPLRGAAKPA